jgi:hypothetical protein
MHIFRRLLQNSARLLHVRLRQRRLRGIAVHFGQPSLFELGAVLQRQLRRRGPLRAAQSGLPHEWQRVFDRCRLLLEALSQRSVRGRLVLYAERRCLRF